MTQMQTATCRRAPFLRATFIVGTCSLYSGLSGAQVSASGAGQNVLVPANTVIDTGATADGYAIYAQDGAQVTAQGFVTLTTGGVQAHGVFANGTNTTILLNQGLRLTTSGSGSSGVVSSGGAVEIRGNAPGLEATIRTVNNDLSPALWALEGGSIAADGVTLITSGAGSNGARAESGGVVTLTNSSATALGDQTYALLATGRGSAINATNLKVETAGEEVAAIGPYGIVSEYGARVTINGVSTVTTSGGRGGGVLSQVGADVGLPDTILTFNGAVGSSILTRGVGAAGAEVCTLALGSPACTPFLAVDVVGPSARAIMNLSNVSVTTLGDSSFGLYPYGQAASLNAQNVTVNTSGATAHAAWVRNGGSLSVADSSLSATGVDAVGVLISSPSGVTGTVDLRNVTLSAAQGTSFRIDGGSANINLSNTTAQTNNGQWLNVAASDAANPSLATVRANASVVNGTAVTATGATANLTLENGALWTMPGLSNLTSFTNNGSSVFFTAPSGSTTLASSYKTLTVNNYSGQNGRLGFNTYLGTDGAPSDRLIINGGAAVGSTGLQINNAGGPGALTVANGIQVVQVVNNGTTAADAFTLANRLVAGPYEYQIYRGAADTSDPQGWYLRSTRLVTETAASGPVFAPRYRPEVGVYRANQRGIEDMFLHSLHDRLGEPQWLETRRSGASDEKRSSGWLRIAGRRSHAHSEDGGVDAKTDSELLQMGGEVAQWDFGGEQARLHLGGMLGYGSSDSKASAADNPNRASGKVEGWNLGAYGTWYQNDEMKLGWYVDTWGVYGAFKNTINSDGMPSVNYDSDGWALSGETGYAFKPLEGRDWVLEPQAQLVYLKTRQDDTFDSNNTQISGDGSGAWVSRLGVRSHAVWVHDDGTRTQPFVTLNWWHHNTRRGITFNQISLPGLYPKDRYEVKFGANAELSKNWNGWANLVQQWGKQSFHASAVWVGMKYTWY